MPDHSEAHPSASGADETGGSRLLIVGLGNPAMADDGIGHAVVKRLGGYGLPRGVRLRAIDDDVLALIQLWENERSIWIVDAVSSGASTGTRHVFEHHDLLQFAARGLSVHHPSLGESLQWILLGRPEMKSIAFRLYGVEVGAVHPRHGLTDAVSDSVDQLVEDIAMASREWAARCAGKQPTTPRYSEAITSS